MGAYREYEYYIPQSTTNIGAIPEITFTSTSSISVKISKTNMTVEPTSYSVTYYKIDSAGAIVSGTSQTVTKTENPFTISGLSTNQSYGISVKASNGSTFGNGVYRTFATPIEYNVAGYKGTVVDANKAAAAKSFLRMSNSSTSPKEYSVAYRTFSAITLPTTTLSYAGIPSYILESINSYSTSHYAFGTKMFLESIIDRTKQSAGFGFFVDGQGNDGYYILIDSTETAGAVNKKEVRICKVKGGDIRVLNDTQKNTVTSLNGVYGGRSYDIDVKVKVNLSSVKINVYINGFLITATDSSGVYEDENGNIVYIDEILDKENERKWLDVSTPLAEITTMLVTPPAEWMNAYPLSPEIKNPRATGMHLLKPIGERIVPEYDYEIYQELEMFGMGETRARKRKEEE